MWDKRSLETLDPQFPDFILHAEHFEIPALSKRDG